MADCVVKPGTIIIKCKVCSALYAPDLGKSTHRYDGNFDSFEQCPICGCTSNSEYCKISAIQYKFIRFFRGLSKA